MQIGDRVRVITTEFDSPFTGKQSGKVGIIVKPRLSLGDGNGLRKDGWSVVFDDHQNINYYEEHLEILPILMLEPDFELDEIHQAQEIYEAIQVSR